ncbi:UNVERIFIED_CONTAM: hypothetical protein GTU68_050818 [Idotea baltica]|nr:hypothetical protein [Idotea baltica]
MCQEAIEEEQVPGIVVLVARHGKIILHKAYGYADVSTNKKMETDNIFRIASQSKAITSTAVMMLWEEGKFQLNDPISKYIPEFEDVQVLDSFNAETGTYTTIPAERAITIRHLLSHTSGLGYGVIDGDPRIKKIYANAGVTDLFTTENISIAESVKKLAKLPLHHHPGERYTYSEGLDVLGYLVEILSGMPFDEYLRTHIFDPLGMDDTWFYLPESKYDRLVTIHHKPDGKWEGFPTTFYNPDYPKTGAKRFFSGGAGLSSTANDYATFLQMYLNDGELNGTRILSRTTINAIMGNQIGDLWEGRGKYHGLAFSVLNKQGAEMGGMTSEGTFEWGGYFNTQYFADPEEGVIGILMKQTQRISNDETGWKYRQLIGQMIDD